jgi:hypothetical protein
MDDLRRLQRVGAIASPAVQDWYGLFCGANHDKELRPPGLYGRDLDFLSDKGSLYRLGVILASAELFGSGYPGRCIVRDRDRLLGSTVIMDSGGFL